MAGILVLIAMPLETMGYFRYSKRRAKQPDRQIIRAEQRHSAHDCRNSVGSPNKPARNLEILRYHFDVSQPSVMSRKPSFKNRGSVTEMDFDMTRFEELDS
jgi:hypothetical protein